MTITVNHHANPSSPTSVIFPDIQSVDTFLEDYGKGKLEVNGTALVMELPSSRGQGEYNTRSKVCCGTCPKEKEGKVVREEEEEEEEEIEICSSLSWANHQGLCPGSGGVQLSLFGVAAEEEDTILQSRRRLFRHFQEEEDNGQDDTYHSSDGGWAIETVYLPTAFQHHERTNKKSLVTFTTEPPVDDDKTKVVVSEGETKPVVAFDAYENRAKEENEEEECQEQEEETKLVSHDVETNSNSNNETATTTTPTTNDDNYNDLKIAQDHLSKGRIYYQASEYDLALEEFQTSLELLEALEGGEEIKDSNTTTNTSLSSSSSLSSSYHEETAQAYLWYGIVQFTSFQEYGIALDFFRRSYRIEFYHTLQYTQICKVCQTWIFNCFKELHKDHEEEDKDDEDLFHNLLLPGHYMSDLASCIHYELSGDESLAQGDYLSAFRSYETAWQLEVEARRHVRRLEVRQQQSTYFSSLSFSLSSFFVTEANLLVKMGQMHTKMAEYNKALGMYRQAVRIYNTSSSGSSRESGRRCISYKGYILEAYRHIADALYGQGWNRTTIKAYLATSLSYGVAHETTGLLYKEQYFQQLQQRQQQQLPTTTEGVAVLLQFVGHSKWWNKALMELKQSITIEESTEIGNNGLALAQLYATVAELYHTSACANSRHSKSQSFFSSSCDEETRQQEHDDEIKNKQEEERNDHDKEKNDENHNDHHEESSSSHHTEQAILWYKKALVMYSTVNGSTHPDTMRMMNAVRSLTSSSLLS